VPPNLALAAGFGAAAAGATVLGVLLALRFRRALDGLLAFGAGVVLGVALLDLFPEALAPTSVATSDLVCTLPRRFLAGYAGVLDLVEPPLFFFSGRDHRLPASPALGRH
jgi:hypothetical protein